MLSWERVYTCHAWTQSYETQSYDRKPSHPYIRCRDEETFHANDDLLEISPKLELKRWRGNTTPLSDQMNRRGGGGVAAAEANDVNPEGARRIRGILVETLRV